MPAREQPLLDRWLEPARRALARITQAEAWAAGARLSLEDACAEAMAVGRPAATDPPGSPTTDRAIGLTSREQEVVALLTAGRTNRQIAEALVIAAGTAQRHVQNILTKLDLHTRAEVAAWAVRHSLEPLGRA